MSKSSEAVKRWRKATKRRIVAAMGGKCQCCGYDKCIESLDLHHKDPNEKEFAFGAMRASPVKWEKIVVELRKCVLVCRNCHGEIHHAERIVPDNAAVFDESYAEYKQRPKCATLKQEYNKRFDWTTVNLAEELKTKSCAILADELKLSAAAVSRQKRKLGL